MPVLAPRRLCGILRSSHFWIAACALAALLLTGVLTACGDGKPLLPTDAVLPNGGRYRGAVVDGRLQGEGRIDYPNGSHYRGSFKDGQWHGQGVWQGANGDRYEGAFKQGIFDGQGRFSYATGGVCEGLFLRGSLNGKGRYTEQGLSYDDEFQRDRYHGNGKLQHADGSTYEGGFTLAQARVAEREQADHYQASEPQFWAPEQVVEHWRALTGR